LGQDNGWQMETHRRFNHQGLRVGLSQGVLDNQKETFVADVAFTVATLAFFVVAIWYLRGCERLK
jgi:hypothetical protein